MSDFLDLQGAKDLNMDAIHLSAVANSVDPVTGSPIATHVNRAGGVDYTLQGFWGAIGPVVMPWTSVVGGTLTQPNQAFLHPTDGNYYAWTGTFPKVVAPGADPALTPGFVLRYSPSAPTGGDGEQIFASVSDVRDAAGLQAGKKVYLLGYYSSTPGIGGGTLMVTDDAVSPDNGGTVFVTGDGVRLKRPRQDSYKLSDFGARANENSTSAIVAAAGSGLAIHVDINTKIVDRGVVLDLGQVWSGAGGSIRQECVVTLPAPPDTSSYGTSAYPLFRLAGGSELIGVTGYPAFEAVHMSGASKLKSCKFFGEGRTWYDGVNCYASNCEISGNEIYDHGQWLSGTTYAARGEGIFISNSASYVQRIKVRNNKCQGNAKNGLFIIGAKMVSATGNEFTANRMSAIQVAFLSGLSSNNASGLTITDNLCEFNGADGFDCNNNSGNPLINTTVNAIVAHNQFRSNGWIYPSRAEQLVRTGTKLETLDGAAATLISVGSVNFIDNEIYDNAKACLFMHGSTSCVISGNRYYKETSHTTDDTDGFRVVSSTNCVICSNIARVPKVAYRIEGACTGTEFYDNKTISATNADGIVTPNGASGFKFFRNRVQIVSGNFITNAIFAHSECEFIATVSGSVTYTGLSDAVFKDNSYNYPSGSIQFSNSVRLTLDGFTVTTSTTSPNGAVRILGLSGISRMRDLNILQGGSAAALLLDGGSFTLYLRDGRVANSAAGNAVRVVNGSASMIIRTDGIDLTTGFNDLTGATRQQVTWA